MDRRKNRQVGQARHRPHSPTHALDRFLLQNPPPRRHHLRLRQQPLHRLLPPHHHPIPPPLETKRPRLTSRTHPPAARPRRPHPIEPRRPTKFRHPNQSLTPLTATPK